MCVLPESRAALTLPPVSSGERKGKLILRRGESVRTLKSEVQPNRRRLKRVKSVQHAVVKHTHTRNILDYDGERLSRGFLILNP